MPNLDGILGSPIRWQNAATDNDLRLFLSDLQANILKAHGRDHAAHIFLSFAGMPAPAVAEIVRNIGQHCTSAYQQLRSNKRYPPYFDGGTVRCLFLSASGYRAIGATLPTGDAFAASMAARRDELGDPDRSEWSPVGWDSALPTPDAMVLIADASVEAVTRNLESVEGWLNGTGVRVLVVERGLQQRKIFKSGAKAEGVEHFGYIDGRSQPLFLAEDLDNEPQNVWKAEFKPSQFIVVDPNGLSPFAAGSYFVFRKLEQNVRGFKEAEGQLADKIFGKNAEEALRERAGAMVVGRFEDGTPIVAHGDAQKAPPENDFNFDNDQNGAKCPFHAHIRKTNPRGDVQRQFNLPDESGDRNPIMARRGITYGTRPMKPDGSDFAEAKGKEPTHNVGLIFMAYMADIEAQFEFTQKAWANNAAFVQQNTGIDPVIGQAADTTTHKHTYSDGWGNDPTPHNFSFANFVKMLGGEYFFAPSLSFLRGVGI